jgi:chromosome partitioning protein
LPRCRATSTAWRTTTYDLILFDCPPAIGYQSMNAVFAADMLYIPSGPGYWEYDSTTSFIGQLAEALADLSAGFDGTFPAGKMPCPRPCRYPLPDDPLRTRQRIAPRDARSLSQGFRRYMSAEHPIEMTRAVEQSGRFLSSVYEIDYREMTRGNLAAGPRLVRPGL